MSQFWLTLYYISFEIELIILCYAMLYELKIKLFIYKADTRHTSASPHFYKENYCAQDEWIIDNSIML